MGDADGSTEGASVITVQLRVNGDEHKLEVSPGRLLLDSLRYDLNLTGTKEGCGTGVCGACTVLLDDSMVSSCLLLTVMADRREIVTIEGVARDGELDGVQRAFIECGGFQCGICTPGQVLAARALLDRTPNPSTAQVIEWMAGNLCRCTGYYKIVEAVMAAAQGRPHRAADTTARSVSGPGPGPESESESGPESESGK